MARSNSNSDIIIEFLPQGRYVKVCAICTETGFEVSIVGDAKATKEELSRIASMKLRRMMEKKNITPAKNGLGIIV